MKDTLIKVAGTALNSKLVASNKTFFSEMLVNAVLKLDTQMNKDLIGVKQVSGGSVTESFLVDGVAFKKTFA